MTSSAQLRKDADAFRTISEVAEALKLPQHVLRFWETRFAQIRPMKRAGGRRFYRPDDIDLLAAISRLLYQEGYTIRGVQRLLKERGARAVAAMARDGRIDPPEADLLEAGERPEESAAGFADDRRPGSVPSLDGCAEALWAVLDDLDECKRLLAAARGA